MAVYDNYATRKRVRGGLAIKERQNRVIFERGLAYGAPGTVRILDIGPGDGAIADLALVAGFAYTAIEGSQSVAESLAQRGIDAHCAYVPPLPPSTRGPYTSCFLLHVLEHMPNAQAASVLLEQIHAVLAPGGALVIACPDYVRWGSDFFDCDYTHAYPVTRRRLMQLASDHAYRVVHQTIYCGPLFGNAGLPLAWLARLAYPRAIDGLFGAAVRADVLNRGLLTFLPNLLTVLQRPL